MSQDRGFITLWGRLVDRFGDNGLVSVLIGRVLDRSVELDIWLMSCRVLNREMELAMFDALVEQCQARGIHEIVGMYIPSKKNGMVANHYASLGFTIASETADGQARWSFPVTPAYFARTRHIRRATVSDFVPKP
jgi:FkbH-like protein